MEILMSKFKRLESLRSFVALKLCFDLEKIQDSKQNKSSLNVVFLHSAYAYDSLQHELALKAMGHFHIPDKITKLMRI